MRQDVPSSWRGKMGQRRRPRRALYATGPTAYKQAVTPMFVRCDRAGSEREAGREQADSGQEPNT